MKRMIGLTILAASGVLGIAAATRVGAANSTTTTTTTHCANPAPTPTTTRCR
jgi:hypothetical protein